MKKFFIKLESGETEMINAISWSEIEEKNRFEFYGKDHEIVLIIPNKNVLIKDITNDPSYFPRRRFPGSY